jgi:predicted transcriptional regulator
MDMIPLKPERKAQLEEYAKRRGQDPATALDDAPATYLEWERQDFAEAVEGVRQGYEDVRAGRTSPPPNSSRTCAASMTFRVETTAAAG